MKRRPRKPLPEEPARSTAGAASPSAIERVMQQTVLLFHRMKATAAELHREGELTAALRGVLYGLLKGGPQTVPQMARSRPVSRQHIQALVNQLLESDLVELRENPAHKRSRLVALTPAGREKIEAMLKREAELFAEYGIDIPEADLIRTAEVLERIREAMASCRFRELMNEEG